MFPTVIYIYREISCMYTLIRNQEKKLFFLLVGNFFCLIMEYFSIWLVIDIDLIYYFHDDNNCQVLQKINISCFRKISIRNKNIHLILYRTFFPTSKIFFPTGRNFFPTGRNLFNLGDFFHPLGFFPTGRNFFPTGRNFFQLVGIFSLKIIHQQFLQ